MKLRLKDILEYVGIFVAVIGIVWLLDTFVIVNARIPSESMENTIMTGDRIIGSRIAYKTGIPHRYDIVIFKYPDDESILYIKRIIGLPGETVTIRDGKVYINDSEEPLDDSFTPEVPTGYYGPFNVPGNGYFVMGDNRNNSFDSRFWYTTCVREDQILGKAIFCYYPFSRFGEIQ
ncbi:MAG: signal peptidase I [Lachnospiraceae bacterium]|nr:signal peptidase I [Lachnospiraceae bacterium]